MNISVILPIYGVEQFIEQALRSLFTQTKTEGMEFILVNDCTKDSSMLIAKRVIAEYSHLDIKIINHQINSGLAVARQTGMDAATGDYVLQIDSDDWCELTMLEELYEMAVANNVDVVVCDWMRIYPKKSIPCKNEVAENGIECMKLLLQGKLSGSVCTKLIKREIITKHNIRQIPGLNNNEDIILSLKVLSYAKRVYYIPRALYNYRMNPNSYSQKPNRKTIQNLIDAVKEIEYFINERGLMGELKEYFMYKKITQKHSLLTITKGTKEQRNNVKSCLYFLRQTSILLLSVRYTL